MRPLNVVRRIEIKTIILVIIVLICKHNIIKVFFEKAHTGSDVCVCVGGVIFKISNLRSVTNFLVFVFASFKTYLGLTFKHGYVIFADCIYANR